VNPGTREVNLLNQKSYPFWTRR